jgi:hypothetical protein
MEPAPQVNRQCKMYRLTGNCFNKNTCKFSHIAPSVASHKKLQLKQSKPFQMSAAQEFRPNEATITETKQAEKKPQAVNQFPGMVNQFPGMVNQFPDTANKNFQDKNHHNNTDQSSRPKLKANNTDFNPGNQNQGGFGQGGMGGFPGNMSPEMWQQQMFMMQQQMQAMNMYGGGSQGGMNMGMMQGMMGGGMMGGGMGGGMMGGGMDMGMFNGMGGMEDEESDDEEDFDEDQFVDECKDCDCCDGFPFICKNSDFCREMDQCFCIMKLQTEETIKEENAAYREDLKDCDCCKGYYLKCHGKICGDLGACHCFMHAQEEG